MNNEIMKRRTKYRFIVPVIAAVALLCMFLPFANINADSGKVTLSMFDLTKAYLSKNDGFAGALITSYGGLGVIYVIPVVTLILAIILPLAFHKKWAYQCDIILGAATVIDVLTIFGSIARMINKTGLVKNEYLVKNLTIGFWLMLIVLVALLAVTLKAIKATWLYILLTVLSVIWVMPILWVILISFREEPGSYTTTFWPQGFTVANYVKLFTDRSIRDFPRWFGNTFIVAVFSCILSTFYVLSVSYVMSRMRFKMRKPFMNVALILGMFPGFMSMIAIYYILKAVGLTEGALKLVALVLVYSGGAGLGFYVAKGFFDTIPKTIDEAAAIDGATKWKIFTRITLPLSKPILVYTIMTSFISPWVDFIFAKVICGAENKYYTVAIGLWSMLEKEYIYDYYTRFCAGAVCISIPIAILFLCTQKYYAEGLSGAVKG